MKRGIDIFKSVSKLASIFSMFTALAAINTLLLGVIPAVRFDGYGEAVGFFDLIQFLPSFQSFMAIISVSGIIITVIFAFIPSVPKIITALFSIISFISSAVALLTVNISIVYSKSGIPAEGISSVKKMGYGVDYSYITAVFLIFNFITVVLAVTALFTANKAEKMRHHRSRTNRVSGKHSDSHTNSGNDKGSNSKFHSIDLSSSYKNDPETEK